MILHHRCRPTQPVDFVVVPDLFVRKRRGGATEDQVRRVSNGVCRTRRSRGRLVDGGAGEHSQNTSGLVGKLIALYKTVRHSTLLGDLRMCWFIQRCNDPE